uniref:ER membrane protein complex subunit 6 n=1 Tax=Panagrolaimus superbus TaxID=310955 RepID=A0A914Y3S2_9BILA
MVEKKSTSIASAAAATTDKEKTNQPVYSEAAVRNNFSILENSRTCQAAASGIASGALGLTGAYGFIFYFIFVLVQAILWEYKAGFKWNTFFVNRSLSITHSIVGGLFTYVLFWVFIYGIVYVY